MRFRFLIEPILHFDFIAAFLLLIYVGIVIIANSEGGAELVLLLIIGGILGSDILISGGLIYIFNYYTPGPAPGSTPDEPSYTTKYLLVDEEHLTKLGLDKSMVTQKAA